MSKLLLTSLFANVASLLPECMPEVVGSGTTVAFIPTASRASWLRFHVRAAERAFERLGVKVDVLDVTTETPDEIRRRIDRDDLIYISGGNTFYLLQELRRHDADTAIREAVISGKPYVGESAGSVIAAPNIAYIHWMDSTAKAPDLHGYADCTALGLVGFRPVPHWGSLPFMASTRTIMSKYDGRYAMKPMRNDEAILVGEGTPRLLRGILA
ncbi:Type 1 glutamine amidotransferase-like domain-containing protein [Bifidobacterium olomucense]|uniref:Peptidase S51 n=1 Tax=Bifidobacterium olomucense TaxID=2675324 RepID=A0A7Y0HV64_9BIFI|nr:Type 1 glutamine amidotransferase-like domain-containing protein [Bifidobacterium sp. DSM 109959]NMM97935.1 peptidase S51 [Bifidobacterium sp. DSM 109959]